MERLTERLNVFTEQKALALLSELEGSDVFVHYKSILVNGHKTLRKSKRLASFVRNGILRGKRFDCD